MPCRPRTLAASFALAACAAPTPTPEPTPAGTAPAAVVAPSLRQVMHDIGGHHAVLRRMLARGENVDLREVATAADAAATGMRLGYGPLEDRAVPGFARMALDAESWLLQVALEARQAHGDIARGLFLGGSQHCVRCHAGCVPTGS